MEPIENMTPRHGADAELGREELPEPKAVGKSVSVRDRT
jgi:hypothetical protein